MRRVGVMLSGLLLVAGCSTPGVAAPADPTGLQLPPRPRDVRIDGVDPCSLLTESQRLALGLDGEPRFDTGASALAGGDVPACTTQGFTPRAVYAGIGIVTTAGIELFASGQVAAEVSALTVQGFPAVRAMPTRFDDYCSVLVDVAPGQMLDIQFADGGRQPPVPQDDLCRDAEATAVAAMTTLLAVR